MKNRLSVKDIVIQDLEYQRENILGYKLAIGAGIDDYYHPVLDDDKILDAIDLVLEFYKDYEKKV